MAYSMKRAVLPLFFLAALGVQGAFWQHTHGIKPELGIVPDVPGVATAKALAFGDEEALFRLFGLQLQVAGDTFGRFTALYKYDYKKLGMWFALLDALNNTSDYIPVMASYYYSQTQHAQDVRYVVDYLYRHSAHRVQKKWWWLTQAVYLASYKLRDKDLALAMAKPLEESKDIPLWAQQLPAFVHEQRGEMAAAKDIIDKIMQRAEHIPPGELNFMRYFVEERLKHLDTLKHNPFKPEPDTDAPVMPDDRPRATYPMQRQD